ncbi:MULTISPECIES: response regulator transcription factor [Cupriavidus]|nr:MULTISPECIES: response regulator transcription factor [Cupriavidus]QYY27682.1 response regulator transcription factor [Cupriavidus pinatubonensis]TPQ38993.1 DNA-binding response regulator [Cupriavidus pinatubonensis]
MSTYLIASNEVMCRVLARRLQALNLPSPIRWRALRWLDEAEVSMSSEHAEDPADIALLDCSGVEGDPRAVLDRLHARLAPRRWLVISDRLDASLMLHAALLGASGCLAAPVSHDLVCAATALVWAGGQCFPRTAVTLPTGTPQPSLVCPAGTTATG